MVSGSPPPIVPDATAARRGRERPEHFSTYVPRSLVRRLKVVSALYDVPLWRLVTEALERYLTSYEEEYGALPQARGAEAAGSSAPEKG